MAKGRKRKSRFGIPHPFREGASTETTIYPDITSGPEASTELPSTERWLPQDSTSAPSIGEESESSEPFAQSQWALIDKYIIQKKLIPFPLIIIILVCGWIIIQDNGAGKLSDWKSIWWTIQKCFAVVIIITVIPLVLWLLKKILKK